MATLVGAGDIAACGSGGPRGLGGGGHRQAARRHSPQPLDRGLHRRRRNAYGNGTPTEFSNCYGPTWGRDKDRLRPAPATTSTALPDAAGYFNYFGPGAAAGPGLVQLRPRRLARHRAQQQLLVGRRLRCRQRPEQWLSADLAASAARCTVAIWHHPRFNSGTSHGNNTEVGPLWNDLYSFGAEGLVINGHEHLYERFAPSGPMAPPIPPSGSRDHRRDGVRN